MLSISARIGLSGSVVPLSASGRSEFVVEESSGDGGVNRAAVMWLKSQV
jgi:hypothetical protein